MTTMVQCEYCKGRGVVVLGIGLEDGCDACEATGKVPENQVGDPCGLCWGLGMCHDCQRCMGSGIDPGTSFNASTAWWFPW